MCAKDPPEVFVAARGEQVAVEFAEGGPEAVGVIERVRFVAVAHAHPVVRHVGPG